jgi:hypothetical protein
MKFSTFFYLTFLSKSRQLWGKPAVTIDDLLALPHQADNNLGGWIVYIDIVIEYIILDDGKETVVGSQTHGLGLYVGSATCQGGGIQRWSEYDRYVPNNLSKDDYSRKGLSSLVLYKAWSHNEPWGCCSWILPSQLYVLANTYGRYCHGPTR